jgi:hypothetical protein
VEFEQRSFVLENRFPIWRIMSGGLLCRLFSLQYGFSSA